MDRVIEEELNSLVNDSRSIPHTLLPYLLDYYDWLRWPPLRGWQRHPIGLDEITLVSWSAGRMATPFAPVD